MTSKIDRRMLDARLSSSSVAPAAAIPLACLAAACLLALATLGCRATPCTVAGTERCGCTSSGGCDPGLTCSSGVCLPPGDPPAGSPPAAPPPSGPAAAPGEPPVDEATIPPLSPRTFVFKKRIRREGSSPWAPAFAHHVYAYDLAARSERLISTLDDPGTGAWNVSGGSVSPDRRWIAFGKQDFRYSPEDRQVPNTIGGILWAVSADGKAFKRLTPPFAEQHTFTHYDVSYRYPVWAPDGRTVYFQDLRSHPCAPTSTVDGCPISGIGAVTDAFVAGWDHPRNACTGEIPLDVHPDGRTLLVWRYNCYRLPNGIAEVTLYRTAPPGEKRYIARQTSERDGVVTSTNLDPFEASWLPDGSAIFIVGPGPTRKATPDWTGAKFRSGVHRWTEAGGVQLFYEPAVDDRDVVDIAISRAGDAVIAVTSRVPDNDTTQLYLLDLQTGKLGAQLTTDGDNVAPAW
jgi:hypothetical protein